MEAQFRLGECQVFACVSLNEELSMRIVKFRPCFVDVGETLCYDSSYIGTGIEMQMAQKGRFNYANLPRYRTNYYKNVMSFRGNLRFHVDSEKI